jgi:septum formation protein
MSEKRKLILGSSSKWRRRVMMKLGVPFDVISPDIDEKSIRRSDPFDLTYEIALAKADALLKEFDHPALIVTCDQVAVFGGEIREKPASADQAREWLRSYRGKTVQTVTAVVVTDVAALVQTFGVDVASVAYGAITEAAIGSAIARGDVLNSCGAFTIDDPDLGRYVEGIEGEKESVEGLPLGLTRSLLEQHGYRLP